MDDNMISIEEAAAEAGLSRGSYVAQLVDSGMLLEHPEQMDPRCLMIRETFPDFPWHGDECNCTFIPGPHPDLSRLD